MPSALAKASKEEVEDMPEEVMSVDSKATKLFKEPYAPKTGKVSMPEVEAASKAAKVYSMEWVDDVLLSIVSCLCALMNGRVVSWYSAKAEKVMSVAKSDKEPAMRSV